jgi:uncharacterized cupin superfamily protein
MRPGTDMQKLGALKPAFKDMGEVMPGFDKVALMKYPHLERINHIHHAGNSSGHRRWRGGGPDRQPRIRRGAWAEAPRPHPRHGQDRHRSHDHADRPGAGDRKDPARQRHVDRRHRPVRGERGLRLGRAALHAGLRRGPRRVNVNGGAIAMGHPLGRPGRSSSARCWTSWNGRARAPALPRCASPAAWARPRSSRGCDAEDRSCEGAGQDRLDLSPTLCRDDGGRSSLRLGEAGGLTQFGVNLVILQPGALSSLRHWHQARGRVRDGDEGRMRAGAGRGRDGDAPRRLRGLSRRATRTGIFINRSGPEARFLVVGTKAPREVGTYSDVDLMVEIEGGKRHASPTRTARPGGPR